jgi:hypothetical protein
MNRGASLDGHLNVTPGGPLRVNDGEGFALGMVDTTTGRFCGASNRGEMVLVRGTGGTDDATYRCTYDGTSAYAWIALTDTTTGDGRYVNVTGDTMTGNLIVSAATRPGVLLTDTDAAADEKTWRVSSNGGFLNIHALTDAEAATPDGPAAVSPALSFTRTANTPSAPTLLALAGTGSRVVEASSAGLLSASRGMELTHFFRLDADGSNIGPGIADFYGSTSAASLDGSSWYLLDFWMPFTKNTLGTTTWTVVGSGNWNTLHGRLEAAGAAPGTAAYTPSFANLVTLAAASTQAWAATAALGAASVHLLHATVLVETINAINIRLRVTSSAGTVTPHDGSIYAVRKLGTANVGTFVA